MKTIKIFLVSILTLVFAGLDAHKNNLKSNLLMETGKKAFEAWQTGEKTGNYTDFKKLLATNFNIFSHPLMGKFSDAEALLKMQNLIAEREKVSNNLTFTNVKMSATDNSVVVQFNSKGTVQNGKFPYEGFNIIVITTEKALITGFEEYFGFVDPSWFK
jgi:hypothetical protein